MDLIKSKDDDHTTVTLLSNGSYNLYNDNSLTSFSNKLHNPISLDPSQYHYVALQEIGISLNAENIPIPSDKPSLIYISNIGVLQRSDLKELTNVFKSAFDGDGEELFINHRNSFGVQSTKKFMKKKLYTPLLIEEEFKSYEELFSDNEVQILFNLESDIHTKLFFEKEYGYKNFVPSFLKQIKIQCLEKDTSHINMWNQKNERFVGILLHEKLARAIKIKTYFRREIKNDFYQFEDPETFVINKDPYKLYFLKVNEEIRGGIFVENNIPLEDNNIINVESNIISPYISNEKFCNVISTFNNLSDEKKFLHYYPNNLMYYRIKSNEIQDINIFISNEDSKQIKLFKDTPTIVKLIIKSQSKMDFTSNLRVSSKALPPASFYNKNSLFRVTLPSNEIFQSKSPKISLSSVTYPNRFKLLPSYLNAGEIKVIFMYKKDDFNLSHDSKASKLINVNTFLSNDPKILVNNLNNIFEFDEEIFNSGIKWKYNGESNKISLSSSKNSYILQIPTAFGNMIGLEKDISSFKNSMVTNHFFNQSWLKYNLFMTNKFIEVYKTFLHSSAYETLSNNNYPPDGYFYLALSYDDEYHIENEINLNMHRPNYALIYNNIIEDSIVDNSYYKILKTIYFEDSNTKWKTISFKNDEYIKIQETNPLYLEFSLRLVSGDLVEFEDNTDDIVMHLKIKNE